MANRNITLSLPEELIKKAKVYAAEHDTTVNALVKTTLEDLVHREDRSREAARRLIEIANRGNRDELHEPRRKRAAPMSCTARI